MVMLEVRPGGHLDNVVNQGSVFIWFELLGVTD